MSFKIRENIKLKYHTTMKVGGNAQYFCQIKNSDNFIEAVKFANSKNLKIHILGGGSNIVVADTGINGIVIKNECNNITFLNETKLICESGVLFSKLIDTTIENSIGNITFASGIPGTVGGAIYGNAGAYGNNIGEFVEKATLIDLKGNIIKVNKKYFDFSYRSSFIKRKTSFIYDITFNFKKYNKEKMILSRKNIINDRNSKHPSLSIGNCGCFFKNILINGKRSSSGDLLDKVNAKKMTVGGASVFNKHANFIINSNNAKASEIYKLAQNMKNSVKEKFNIELEEEIRYWGKF